MIAHVSDPGILITAASITRPAEWRGMVDMWSAHLCQLKCVFMYSGWTQTDGYETFKINEFGQPFCICYAWCKIPPPPKKNVACQDGMTLKDQAHRNARFGELFNIVPRGCHGFLVYRSKTKWGRIIAALSLTLNKLLWRHYLWCSL